MYIKTASGWMELQRVKGVYCPHTNSYSHVVKAPHDKSLLETLGIDPRDCTQQYINAVDAYIADEISWEKCLGIIGSRRLLPNGGL